MNLEEKLGAVEALFTRGSKSFQVAVDIIRKNRDVTMAERALMAEKIGCADSTVNYVLTRLRKAGLYGSYDEPSTPQKTQEEEEEKEEPTEEEPEPKDEFEELEETEEKYVTVEDFNRFVGELRAFMGLTPIQEPEAEYVEEQFEAPEPESIDLEEASMKQMGTWIEAKNLIYFDFARNGAFGGGLEDFDGNWSDFVNTVIDDYFKTRMNVGIGLIRRRAV